MMTKKESSVMHNAAAADDDNNDSDNDSGVCVCVCCLLYTSLQRRDDYLRSSASL